MSRQTNSCSRSIPSACSSLATPSAFSRKDSSHSDRLGGHNQPYTLRMAAKSLFSKDNLQKCMTPLRDKEFSDVDSQLSGSRGDVPSLMSSKSMIMSTNGGRYGESQLMTPRQDKSTFSTMRKVDHQKEMRKNIFTDSNVYLGFSSSKRTELAQSLKLPSIYKSQIYKEEEPMQNIQNHKTMVQRKASNSTMRGIREYGDNRRSLLESLGTSQHTRSTSSIFGLQKRSFQ